MFKERTNMRNSKILLSFISTLLIICLFCGCSTKYQGSIYSDDAKIAKDADSASFELRLATTTKVSDGTNKTISFGSFNGDETIFIANAQKDSSVIININSEIKSGSFKVVLIGPNKKVSVLSKGTEKSNSELIVKKGINRFKIVGKSAKGKIVVIFKPGSNIIMQNAND
jgi:hypothetical protein